MKKRGPRNYFGIGIYKTKYEENVGTLWRSAYQMGANFIFTVAKRYKPDHPTNTLMTHRHIPLFEFDTLDEFESAMPQNSMICPVDFGENSTPLPETNHPKRAIYLLGAEDKGLPEKFKYGKQKIEIPSIRMPSYNVAVAGSIVMYDRIVKNKS